MINFEFLNNYTKKMKKLILTSSLIFAIVFMTSAQSNLEAGLRFGGGNDNVAIDGTIPLAAKPRLHPSIYLNDGGVTIGTYFDWMFPFPDVEGLSVYPGVGPEFFFYNEVNLGVAGNFGIEYAFDFPLTVGFDWRPGILLTTGGDFHSANWGLIARYRIK